MKQNNSTELLRQSFNRMYPKNDPDPLNPKSAFFLGFSGIRLRTQWIFMIFQVDDILSAHFWAPESPFPFKLPPATLQYVSSTFQTHIDIGRS